MKRDTEFHQKPHKMYETISTAYNHNFHHQLNSLNFQMSARNLNVIYRFILKEIQCLNGDRNKKKGNNLDNFEIFCLPPRLQCEMSV